MKSPEYESGHVESELTDVLARYDVNSNLQAAANQQVFDDVDFNVDALIPGLFAWIADDSSRSRALDAAKRCAPALYRALPGHDVPIVPVVVQDRRKREKAGPTQPVLRLAPDRVLATLTSSLLKQLSKPPYQCLLCDGEISSQLFYCRVHSDPSMRAARPHGWLQALLEGGVLPKDTGSFAGDVTEAINRRFEGSVRALAARQHRKGALPGLPLPEDYGCGVIAGKSAFFATPWRYARNYDSIALYNGATPPGWRDVPAGFFNQWPALVNVVQSLRAEHRRTARPATMGEVYEA